MKGQKKQDRRLPPKERPKRKQVGDSTPNPLPDKDYSAPGHESDTNPQP